MSAIVKVGVVAWLLCVPVAALVPAIASAQNYPTKPVRIVTGGTGSNSDFAARLIAQGLTAALKQQVIVENRPSGVILGEIVAKSAPDGYTLLVSASSFWLAPFLQHGLPWDPVRDFAPIILACTSPNLVVVHPSLAVKSIAELIAFARARPGVLNYASGATGSSPHLSAELFKTMAGVNITRINYRGSGPAMNDLISGQVKLMFAAAASVMTHVKSGRLRALAVTTAQTSAVAPDLPTVAASGVPGYAFESITGMFAPAKTPDALVRRLNRETVAVLKSAEVRERFFNSGVETVGSSPEELAATVRAEMSRLGKLIKDAGIQNE